MRRVRTLETQLRQQLHERAGAWHSVLREHRKLCHETQSCMVQRSHHSSCSSSAEPLLCWFPQGPGSWTMPGAWTCGGWEWQEQVGGSDP